jgi:hypothetical protein
MLTDLGYLFISHALASTVPHQSGVRMLAELLLFSMIHDQHNRIDQRHLRVVIHANILSGLAE